MAKHWVHEAFESALTVIDNGELVRAAGLHVQPEGEWSQRKIRPSLLGGECNLQTIKKFRGHGAQPGSTWMAVKQGRPDANSNLVFARGFLGEGLVVAALKRYGELSGDYEVLGCAPELLFSAQELVEDHEGRTYQADYEAHPDLMVLRRGEIELIQIKTPSVWAFERAERSGELNALQKYRAQMVTEMYVGRLMDFDIARNVLLMFTWEGWLRGGKPGIRALPVNMEWDDSMAEFVRTEAAAILRMDADTQVGMWPEAANREDEYSKWPCSYCQYARTKTYDNQVICTEVEKWENMTESPMESVHRAMVSLPAPATS